MPECLPFKPVLISPHHHLANTCQLCVQYVIERALKMRVSKSVEFLDTPKIKNLYSHLQFHSTHCGPDGITGGR